MERGGWPCFWAGSVRINAFREVAGQPEFSDLILAMVGDTSGDAFHTYFGEVAAHVEALGLLDRAVFTGFLKEDVAALLNLARVLLLPSLMEGFGLPALEAAACGCPVIATKASPLEGCWAAAEFTSNRRKGRLRARWSSCCRRRKRG